jgi:hypothetical protein
MASAAQLCSELRSQVADLLRRARGDAELVPDPVRWAERVTGSALDPWQRRVMVSEDPALLLLTSRQVGKSHVVSLRAAYRAKYLRRRVGVLSPTLRQSSIVYRRAKSWIRSDGRSRLSRQTLTELEIEGGGAVVAFPGDRPDLSIRGDTLDDLIVDEASRVKDELIAAATPTTATKAGANITYLSTPAGARGAFYKAWSEEAFWNKITVRAEECSRILPTFLARERERLGPLFAQEYECEFLVAPGGVFDPGALADVFGAPLQPAPDDWLPHGNGHARQWI